MKRPDSKTGATEVLILAAMKHDKLVGAFRELVQCRACAV